METRYHQNSQSFIYPTLRNNSIFNLKVPGSQCLGAFKKTVESVLKKLERKESKNRNIWKLIKDIGKKKEVVLSAVLSAEFICFSPD